MDKMRVLTPMALFMSAMLLCDLQQLLAGPDPFDEPDRVCWVQVANAASVASPEALMESLENRGYDPVFLYPSQPEPTIRVGQFSVYMDAYLLWEDLKDSFPDARIRHNFLEEEEAAGRSWDLDKVSVPPSSREVLLDDGVETLSTSLYPHIATNGANLIDIFAVFVTASSGSQEINMIHIDP